VSRSKSISAPRHSRIQSPQKWLKVAGGMQQCSKSGQWHIVGPFASPLLVRPAVNAVPIHGASTRRFRRSALFGLFRIAPGRIVAAHSRPVTPEVVGWSPVAPCASSMRTRSLALATSVHAGLRRETVCGPGDGGRPGQHDVVSTRQAAEGRVRAASQDARASRRSDSVIRTALRVLPEGRSGHPFGARCSPERVISGRER
jgi:hypothetical protein